MHTRNKFVTNSSSSCMIMWEKDPKNYPKDMKPYYPGVFNCPHCGEEIFKGGLSELDDYIDDEVKLIIEDKLRKGCAIFWNIEYMGAYAEDEQEHGTDESGWYSFQGGDWY
jgi:hypothetical protein